MYKLILLTILFPSILSAQKDYSSLLDKYMQAQVNVNEFSGDVLVAQKEKIIYEKAFGLANKEWNIPNTIETKFRIGSITKQFTAAAILQLAEKGKLNLEDNLNKYFPDFPKGDSVTIHMLLNHTSGIKSFTSLPNFSSLQTLPYSKDSVVAVFKNQPYDFSPGTSWNYSNSGYFLLGYIIEKASGQSYSTYVYENEIKKAGLKNTAVNQLDSILMYRASGYDKTPAGWKNAEYISMEFPYSAGALFSTVEDLYAWEKALYEGKIISQVMVIKMTTPYLHQYGYGLGIDSFQNHKRIGHSGGIPGFQSYSGYYPSDDVSIIVLSNYNSGAVGIANALAATLFDMPVVAPYQHKEVKIDASILNRYEGKFQNSDHSIDTLKVKAGKLYIHPQGDSNEYELKPESETKFFLAVDPDYQFEFEVDKRGTITKAYLIAGGIKTEMKKL